jgi:hypothetical protein
MNLHRLTSHNATTALSGARALLDELIELAEREDKAMRRPGGEISALAPTLVTSGWRLGPVPDLAQASSPSQQGCTAPYIGGIDR